MTALVEQARRGDADAFRRLTGPYRRELHVHCYRLLGSVQDAEDMVQETLLLAWRRLDTYRAEAPFRAWLYRIATNASLSELRKRRRRGLPQDLGPPWDPSRDFPLASDEVAHVEPYPDAWLDELDPADVAVGKETIELAFITMIQRLPPKQRAVLVLRDVLGWPASEVAQSLGTSVAAVNSALQRARTTMNSEAITDPREFQERELLDRYARAWEAGDLRRLANLLSEDAVLTMPPGPNWYQGREDMVGFFAKVLSTGRRLRVVPIRANRQPAFAAYERQGSRWTPYGLMVLDVKDGRITAITGFAETSLFDSFELPAFLED